MSVTRGRPIIVAASTHPGEEEILIEAHRTLAGFFPSLLTVIVPRHPDRGEAIARIVAAAGLHVGLRSREELPTAATDIYVADTMGELGLFYRLAPIVFMGGSLVAHGGQNPIEAVKLGASIVHGPHVFNFTDVYEALDRAGGARQADTHGSAGEATRASCWPIRRRATCRWRPRPAWSNSSAARSSARSRRSNPISCSCGSKWEPPMREPAFWHRPPSWTSRLLMPLGALYGAVAGRRMQRPGFDAGIPVLCVGNYHTGGAGKTPTVLALTQLLRDLGETPVVLSRGYGGRLRGPVTVDAVRHAAADVGDEPLMLARTVAVVVARDRVDGVALARSQGASVILMDDGFQNPAIAKDASLIVIDADRGLGNACVFPAGPLRAPLDAATRPHRRADRDRRWRRGQRGRRRDRRAGRPGAVGASAAE